jgi:thioredoxin reductase
MMLRTADGHVKANVDSRSIAGKGPRAERRVPVVVVGAGAAGVAAAVEAARAGAEVALVDEHPIDHDLMAMDVPLHFGGRMAPALRGRALALERAVEANPGLAEAVEAGVDVLVGTSVWGAFRNGPTVRELDGPLLGLADDRRSWLIGYDRLVVATGARDVGMAFAGWEKAGVMGAAGAAALLVRYRALASRRMVILGSGALGLGTSALALDGGVEVAAVVEVAAEVAGDAAARRALERRGVAFYTSHAVKAALGATGEVEAVVLVRLDGDGKAVAGSEREVACDTVCLALGLSPQVELLSLLGCRLQFRSELGGFVPEVDDRGRTSVAGVFAAGDCAGYHDGMLAEPGIARDQGRAAGRAAAESLDAAGRRDAEAARATPGWPDGGGGRPVHGYWRAWLEALIAAGGLDVNVCQCEEVTRRELCGVSPPRYLGWRPDAARRRTVATVLRDGPVSPDQVKRLTRAGMGPCQGRRCREQVALLLAREAGVDVGRIPLATYRPPVRPLPLSVLWPHDEPQAMRDEWVGWFGIPTQFAPQWVEGPTVEPAAEVVEP